MSYVISTTWKHDNPIVPAQFEAALAATKEDSAKNGVVDVYWFKIDDHTHGSVLIYESEEAADKHQATLKGYRSRPGIEMLREERGPTLAVLSEL